MVEGLGESGRDGFWGRRVTGADPGGELAFLLVIRKGLHDLHGRHAYADHLAHKAHDVSGISSRFGSEIGRMISEAHQILETSPRGSGVFPQGCRDAENAGWGQTAPNRSALVHDNKL